MRSSCRQRRLAGVNTTPSAKRQSSEDYLRFYRVEFPMQIGLVNRSADGISSTVLPVPA